jgi:Beta/Gamma crystallin
MRIHKALGPTVLLGAIAALAASFVAGQDRGDRDMGRVGITVFENPDYRGRNATFRDEVPNLSDYNLNDRISSFRIARGESWEVCEHKDFGGRCTVFSGDEPDLARVSWNDMITSLRPVRGRQDRDGRDRDGRDRDGRDGRRRYEEPRLILFERPDFRGRSREVTGTEDEISDFNDRAQSARAVGRWELCEHKGFRGRCVTISGDVPDLEAFRFRNKLTSARPIDDRR